MSFSQPNPLPQWTSTRRAATGVPVDEQNAENDGQNGEQRDNDGTGLLHKYFSSCPGCIMMGRALPAALKVIVSRSKRFEQASDVFFRHFSSVPGLQPAGAGAPGIFTF